MVPRARFTPKNMLVSTCVVATQRQSAETLASTCPRPLDPQEQDTLVRVCMGGHETLLSLASMAQKPSILPQLHAWALARQARDDYGMVTLMIEGDGPGFRHLACYLRSGSLPLGLTPPDLGHVARTAETLHMPSLVLEAQSLYPLREAVRLSAQQKASAPCDFVADSLMLAGQLILHRFECEGMNHMRRAAAIAPPLSFDAIASAAYNDANITRSSLMFAYPLLRSLAPTGQLTLLKHLMHTPVQHHFLVGPGGAFLQQRDAPWASQLFLDKLCDFTAQEEPECLAQKIEVKLLAAKQWHEAETQTRAQMQLHPDSAALAGVLGIALHRLGQSEEALMYLERMANSPKQCIPRAAAFEALGMCRMAKGAGVQGLDALFTAHLLAPYDDLLLWNLANKSRDLVPTEMTERWLGQLISLTPTFASAHLALAELYEQTARYPDAQRHYTQVGQLRPDDAHILQKRVELALHNGDVRQALELQHQLVLLAPGQLEAWRTLNMLKERVEVLDADAAQGCSVPQLRIHPPEGEGRQATLAPAYVPSPIDASFGARAPHSMRPSRGASVAPPQLNH